MNTDVNGRNMNMTFPRKMMIYLYGRDKIKFKFKIRSMDNAHRNKDY